jgi:hypothetical protein
VAVTAEWRTLAPGETDHELLWGAVGLATTAVAVLAWATGAVVLPACVFKVVTGLPCVTCGSTRALAALAAGEVLAAVRWNPLAAAAAFGAVVYVPYGAMTGLAGSRRVRLRLAARDWRFLRAVALVTLAATWAFLVADRR